MSQDATTLISHRSKLWNEYCDLSLKAQKTLDHNDSLAAGEAYRAFMDDFLSPAQRDELGATKFPNGRPV